jgi:signal transduction histidine kinase
MSQNSAGKAVLESKDVPARVDFLSGGGELGRLIREFDWPQSPLGPLESWPQSLKTATAILLRSPVPIVLLWGAEGVMIYNDAYAVFGGARHPQLLGSTVLEGWPEVADFNANVMRVGLGGGTLAYRDQHLVLHRPGRAEDVWMNLDYSPVLDEQGNPAGVLAIVVETTERVVGERRLRTLREIGSRTTPARSVDAVCQSALTAMSAQNPADLPCALLYLASGETLQLAAHYGAEPRQRMLHLHAGDETELGSAIERVHGEGSRQVSAQALICDGARKLERFQLLPITSGSALAGVLAIGEAARSPRAVTSADSPDTARLHQFLELLASQLSNAIAAAQTLELTRMRAERDAQFRAFVGATSDAVFRISADWSEMRHLEGNGFVADTREPARDWLERYIPPSDQPQVRAAIQEMLQTRRCPSFEHRVLRLDGSVGWALSRAVPIEDANGEIFEWFGTTSDITERKLAEAEIARAEEKLRAEARQKDEFLAMLAHELRNPLAPITNASELLLHTVKDRGRARLAIEMIRRQARHLTRMVDDLLDVSRITQGRIQLKRTPVNIAQVIAQAIEMVESQLREKHLRVSSTSSSYELYVDGDLPRLIQCVVNVLGNSVKYTDRAGEIRIQTRAEGTLAVIEIADNGVGIAPELLPRIFDLFVQGDRTLDRAEGGLGIGLSVVKRLIEMHNGEVVAASPGIGLGAAFQIRLPRSDRPRPQPLESPKAATGAKRILVVDDNADAAESLAMLLSLQGHETRVALSGKEALEGVETFAPDVALLDLGLPEMDGYELAARLRAMGKLPDILLVALTGYGRSEDRQKTQAAGFDDHLVKPVDLAALARALDRSH